MFSQPLTHTRRIACLAVLGAACAGTTSASALACPAGSGLGGAQAGQRVVQQHVLQTRAAVSVVCTSVYPLRCHG